MLSMLSRLHAFYGLSRPYTVTTSGGVLTVYTVHTVHRATSYIMSGSRVSTQKQ